MRTTAHLAHQALLLHLAAELTQRLLELLLVLDDYLQAFTFSLLSSVLWFQPPLEAHPGYATGAAGAAGVRNSFRFDSWSAGSLSAWLNAWRSGR